MDFDTAAGTFVGPPAPVRQGFGEKPAPVVQPVDKRAEKAHAASRSATRAPHAAVRAPRTARAVVHPVARKTRAKVVRVARHAPGAGRHRAAPQPQHRVVRHVARVVHRKAAPRPVRRIVHRPAGHGLGAVVAFARAHVGHSYGGNWDCSGFVKQAYARAGINLPHQSGAIAARAYSISRQAARPGDLVVGHGHVGIYMGGGMMIDAGNSRVGVSYRRMYAGLWLERLV